MYILCSYWLFHFRFGGSKDKQTTLALPISARTLPYHPIFVATVQCSHYAQLPPGSLGVFLQIMVMVMESLVKRWAFSVAAISASCFVLDSGDAKLKNLGKHGILQYG